jgi:7,8-dihydro-6-hydroxymethylpterin dimethyltransferase
MPLHFNSKTHYGCPYDCGLCPDHEQHSCLTVVEITDRCNLQCPTCYAMSSPHYGRHRTVEEVERMLDIIVANEGTPDVVQISGGEPTIHPDFFAILDIAKQKPIKHLMVNTNGIRIAKDKAFASRLASYAPDFELYLQFDSFKPAALEQLRGKDLTDIRIKALEHLNELNLSTTLVVTLQQGVNDDEIGQVIDFALQQRCVRGVTFQPTQVAGRTQHFNPATDRITMTDVRRRILQQTNVFMPNDLVPVPCNPDALVMGYALKLAGQVFPLTRYIDPAVLLDSSRNTIVYEQDEALKEKMISIFSTGISVDKVNENMKQLLCCLPQIQAPGLSYDNLFRVIIMRFVDAYDFDVRAIKKSCVHIVHKDGRIIPFETMNLFYRDEKEVYLKQLQNEKAGAPV